MGNGNPVVVTDNQGSGRGACIVIGTIHTDQTPGNDYAIHAEVVISGFTVIIDSIDARVTEVDNYAFLGKGILYTGILSQTVQIISVFYSILRDFVCRLAGLAIFSEIVIFNHLPICDCFDQSGDGVAILVKIIGISIVVRIQTGERFGIGILAGRAGICLLAGRFGAWRRYVAGVAVSRRLDHRLSNQNRATHGAMGAFGLARFRAGGGNGFVGHHRVTGGRNCLGIGIITALIGAGIGLYAILGAGGSRCHSTGAGVTMGDDGFSFCCAAGRAGVGHYTVLGASGSRCHHAVIIAMPNGRRVAADIGISTGAAGTGCIALLRTGGSCHLRSIAVIGGSCVITYIGFSADATGIGGIALCRAGGSCYLRGIAVADGGNYCLLNNDCIADRAVASLSQTAFGAGGCHSSICHGSVSRCCNCFGFCLAAN